MGDFMFMLLFKKGSVIPAMQLQKALGSRDFKERDWLVAVSRLI